MTWLYSCKGGWELYHELCEEPISLHVHIGTLYKSAWTLQGPIIPIYPWLDFPIFFLMSSSFPPYHLSQQPATLCSDRHLGQPGTLHFPGCQPWNLQHFLEKAFAIFTLVIFCTSVADVGRTKLQKFAPAIWLVAMPSKFLLTLSTLPERAKLFLWSGQHCCSNQRADVSGFQGFLIQPISLDSKQVFRTFSKRHISCLLHNVVAWRRGVLQRQELGSSLC